MENEEEYQIQSETIPSISFCFCLKEIKDRQTALIIFVAVIYFLSVAITAIPITLLINKRIGDGFEDPTELSVLVATTASFLHSFCSFIAGRYTSGMGDYVGRKPVLVISTALFILSRLTYLKAQRPVDFFVAAIIGGICDCFYFSSLAWICDVWPEGKKRSKRVGIFTGICGGIAFTIGIPFGAVVADEGLQQFPLKLAMIMGLIVILVLTFLPVDDTLGSKTDLSEKFIIFGRRSVPVNFKKYMLEHFPISLSSIKLIKEARFPYDWLTNFLMHSTSGVVNLIFIQYCLAVFDWTAVQAAGGVLTIGLCLGVLAPTFMHRYDPLPLAFYTMGSFTVGLGLLSIAGSGIVHGEYIAIAGIMFLALGTSWVPSLQTNLLSQYGATVQGSVSGLLSQQTDASLVPAYIMSLGFTISLSRKGQVFWPGSTFFAVSSVKVILVVFLSKINRRQFWELLRCASTGILMDLVCFF